MSKRENKRTVKSFEATTVPALSISKDRLKVYHKINILIDLFCNNCYDLPSGKTATDYHCSNANQYLCDLEQEDLITRLKLDNEIFKRAFINYDQFDRVVEYFTKKDIDILKRRADYANGKY